MVWESFRMAIKSSFPQVRPRLFSCTADADSCVVLLIYLFRHHVSVAASPLEAWGSWARLLILLPWAEPAWALLTRSARPPARLCGASGPWPLSARNMTGGHVSKRWNPAGVGLYKVTAIHFTSFLSRFKEATRKLEVAHGSPWIPPGRRRGLLTPSLHSSYQAVLTLVSGAPLTPCIKKDIFFFFNWKSTPNVLEN